MAALEAAGHDTANLTVEMLNLVDQMHFGGLDSTKRQAEALGLVKGMRVLDAGCGIGGSSRYLAHTYGCRIKAIDLTSQLVEAAAEGATPSAMRHAVPLARRTIHCRGRGSRPIVFLARVRSSWSYWRR